MSRNLLDGGEGRAGRTQVNACGVLWERERSGVDGGRAAAGTKETGRDCFSLGFFFSSTA